VSFLLAEGSASTVELTPDEAHALDGLVGNNVARRLFVN
jgi:hypothetical protein